MTVFSSAVFLTLFGLFSAGFSLLGSMGFISLLQLEGYRVAPAIFCHYVTKKRMTCLFLPVWAVSAALGVIAEISGDGVVFAVCFALSVVLFYSACTAVFLVWFFSKKSSPPAFTPRLIRIICAAFLVDLALALLLRPLFAATGALLPLAACIATVVLLPFEKLNNLRYIVPAVKKLRRLSESGMMTVAVTGSYGKTTVKNIIATFLSLGFKVAKTPSSFNTPLGLCRAVADISENADVFVCEFGARRRGDIRELARLAPPDVAVITGVAPQHVGTFGSIENIIAEKLSIIGFVKKKGRAYVNGADVTLKRSALEASADISERVIAVNCEGADIVSENCSLSLFGSEFDVVEKQSDGSRLRTRIITPLLSSAAVENITLAYAVARSFGVSPERIAASCATLRYTPHRCQPMRSGDVLIIDDSYNCNICGVRALCALFAHYRGRRVAVTCGIVEGGVDSESLNREVGRLIASAFDVAILSGVASEHIARGIAEYVEEKRNGSKGVAVYYAKGADRGRGLLRETVKSGDAIAFINDPTDNFQPS